MLNRRQLWIVDIRELSCEVFLRHSENSLGFTQPDVGGSAHDSCHLSRGTAYADR